ncbi:MAG TPA: hydroxymethylglutaryl-CoA reductase, degradative [Polyangiaceae bacterium]|jgi:hydroxymethylglutaryl-CoA reductase|nr:hydroxymethylglutaryl-CoA reductase, degradative [Polyangiaceae bacterium]
MTQLSRIPGFYKLSIAERHAELSRRTHVPEERILEATSGGIDVAIADKVVENVLGVYGLPFGVALNVAINGKDRLAPMVVEEPSVIAAASNAARMVRAGGGFQAETLGQLMIGQIELWDVPNLARAREAIERAKGDLLGIGASTVPNMVRRGGGPVDLVVRVLSDSVLVVHVHVDCKDAMGANLVNTIAETMGPEVARLAQAKLGLRILSNLCDQRRVRVRARVPCSELVMSSTKQASWAPSVPRDDGTAVADAIERASRFAELDPYRAATHNKGIMNGIDSVVIATGNDYRAVEAGAHAYAAKDGKYGPLATWRRAGSELLGELELPLALGIVGGTLRVHPTARLAIELSQVESAAELAELAAAVGLASNLAALRALATEGIQRGHMSLHARSVATLAGAVGAEVERIAAELSASANINLDHACALLAKLRSE